MEVLADGVRLDVRVEGVGDAAVVLLHGFPLTRDIWQAQVQSLARTHRTVCPDLRGMGSSALGDVPLTMEVLADDVAAILDALEIDRAAVVGHSLGGYVALAFARKFSERMTHIGFVCSRLAADAPAQAVARKELADRVEALDSIEPAIDAYVSRMFPERTMRERPALVEHVRNIARTTPPKGAAEMMRGMATRAPGNDVAPRMDVPAMILAGGADTVITVTEAREDARTFGNGYLVVCESSGHLPMLEEPEQVSAAIEALCSS
jgi:3-oxoadipate enol-lactonase